MVTTDRDPGRDLELQELTELTRTHIAYRTEAGHVRRRYSHESTFSAALCVHVQYLSIRSLLSPPRIMKKTGGEKALEPAGCGGNIARGRDHKGTGREKCLLDHIYGRVAGSRSCRTPAYPRIGRAQSWSCAAASSATYFDLGRLYEIGLSATGS